MTNNDGHLTEADVRLVNQYADGELAADDRTAFEARLAEEPALQLAIDQILALRSALSKLPKPTVSDTYRARIARLSEGPMSNNRSTRTLGDWRLVAATAMLSFGIGAFASHTLTTSQSLSAARQQVVAAHQHALLATDPVEIASSDRHTVKPWFDRTLAISPPVVDLAGDGFPLLGGRTDSIDDKRVPVLIYRHRNHLVSVVAVPEAGGTDQGNAPTLTTRDGYSVLTWRGADFSFSAIADIAQPELIDFVEKLRRVMRSA